MILVACKPRHQWPAYFTLSVHEMRNEEGRGGANSHNDDPNHVTAPLLVGAISNDFLYKHYDTDRCDSIGSNDAVIFLNPVKYTLDETDFTDRSAFDDEISEEVNLISRKLQL